MAFVPFISDLDAPLLRISRAGDALSIRHGAGGIHFFAGIGGGKSSSAHVLAGAYLRAGMGALVTISKSEDVPLWKDTYAPKHGRAASVVVFDENEGFNFLDYLMRLDGVDGIGSVVECLMRVIEAARRASGTASQRGGEVFWEDATRNVLRYALPPLYAAKGTLSIPDILRFVATAPATLQEPISAEWQKRSFMYGIMKDATNNPKVRMSVAALKNIIAYWTEQWPAIPEKTRGNIVITITAALDRFNHGRLNRAFCGKTTIVPELSFHGGVILLAMPTLTWHEDGVIAQQLFKFLWQRAVLSRNSLEEKHRTRPVFLWSDEAQETVSSYDFEFQSLCRASKCCTVYLTQSLPTYYAKIGGDNPRDAAHALVGKFMTHVYGSNSCPETNDFAARTIGKVVRRRANYSNGTSRSVNIGMNAGSNENHGSSDNYGSSYGGQSTSMNHGSGSTSGSGNSWGQTKGRGTSRNESRGYTESMEFAIEPGDFGRILQTGGPANGNIVSAVWYQAGRVFEETGTNWLLARFRQ